MTSHFTLDGAAPLDHLGVIRASGPDAATFLHGQLTNDLALLDTHRARLAGYCSPKGRLLASFVVWKTSPDEVLLLCSADVLPATLKRLSMFVLRAKCKLSDATSELQLRGLAGPSASAWLADAAPHTIWGRTEREGASVVRLPDVADAARYLWVGPSAGPAPELPSLSAAAWRWGEVQSGIATIEAPTVDQFVPQMLNYELLGGVDFKKGCYPGQEVVARSQYRGTIKRRTYLFLVGASARPGQEIFHSADPVQPAGMVVNAADLPDPAGASTVLAEMKLAAMGEGSLHLGAADGPLLSATAMPYDVTTEAAD